MVMEEIHKILQTVADPEIPVISIVDLGIVREVRLRENIVEIDITPTYSGCPALDVIPILIEEAMNKAGYQIVRVKNILSPPWTTDWISETGLQNLKEFGIAPPVEKSFDKSFLTDAPKVVPCPRCNSNNTRLVSQFGSTPCKSAFQCNECLEPFDYFKCH